jgi:hypothetical protein
LVAEVGHITAAVLSDGCHWLPRLVFGSRFARRNYSLHFLLLGALGVFAANSASTLFTPIRR